MAFSSFFFLGVSVVQKRRTKAARHFLPEPTVPVINLGDSVEAYIAIAVARAVSLMIQDCCLNEKLSHVDLILLRLCVIILQAPTAPFFVGDEKRTRVVHGIGRWTIRVVCLSLRGKKNCSSLSLSKSESDSEQD